MIGYPVHQLILLLKISHFIQAATEAPPVVVPSTPDACVPRPYFCTPKTEAVDCCGKRCVPLITPSVAPKTIYKTLSLVMSSGESDLDLSLVYVCSEEEIQQGSTVVGDRAYEVRQSDGAAGPTYPSYPGSYPGEYNPEYPPGPNPCFFPFQTDLANKTMKVAMAGVDQACHALVRRVEKFGDFCQVE